MSATGFIEQFKRLPTCEQAQVAKFIIEQNDSWILESFKVGMVGGEAGRFMDIKAAFVKWRGRGHLLAGKNTDDYLHLTHDDNISNGD